MKAKLKLLLIIIFSTLFVGYAAVPDEEHRLRQDSIPWHETKRIGFRLTCDSVQLKKKL